MCFHASRLILRNVRPTPERTRTRWMDLETTRSDEWHANLRCRDFTEFLAGILTEHMGFKRGKLERCLSVHDSNETRVVSHVDDPLICAQITKLVVIKRGEGLNRRIPVTYLGFEYRSVHDGDRRGFTVKPSAKYVDECLDIVQLQFARAVMTPLTEQKRLNLHDETTACDQVHSLFRAVVRNCSTLLE